MERFSAAVARGDTTQLHSILCELAVRLDQPGAHPNLDHAEWATRLISMFERETAISKGATAADPAAAVPFATLKVASRNLVTCLQHNHTRAYDFASKLLSNIGESETHPRQFKASVLAASDVFRLFPALLGLLNNFAIAQLYKLLKRQPTSPHVTNAVYLLAVITENATRLDIDDKLQHKLLKIVLKSVLVPVDRSGNGSGLGATNGDSAKGGADAEDPPPSDTILIPLKRNYYVVLRNLLVLAVTAHYEQLLAASAASSSSSSSLSKLKPEHLMAQQHSFQMALLALHDKVIQFGLTNRELEIRAVAIDLVARLMVSFVPTSTLEASRFSPLEWLILTQFRLPPINNWDHHLARETTTVDASEGEDAPYVAPSVTLRDSQAIINAATALLLLQTSIVQALVLYIQLEQVQNLDFISANFTTILDLVLTKFGELNLASNHIQNQHWIKVLRAWSAVISWLIAEGGSNCHDMLLAYVHDKFREAQAAKTTSGTAAADAKLKRRESGLFNGFKVKSSRDKERELKQKEINPMANSYQCYFLLQVANQLIPLGVSGNGTSFEATPQATSAELVITSAEEDTDNTTTSHTTSFLRELLFRLVVSDSSYIRVYALDTLLLYAKHHEVEVNQLILRAFKLVDAEFKTVREKKPSQRAATASYTVARPQMRLIQYSLVLAALIKTTPYTALQTATTIKILSFCTQNLKQTRLSFGDDTYTRSACWIMLTALITMYNDSEFVRLNSSQFLVFWKGLLTSQYLGGSASATMETKDVLSNLRVRNFALCCLLNYLSTAELTPDTLRQLQLLLAKSYNYITYLENIYSDGVGQITTFNATQFSVGEFNVDLVNNIQYSNYDQGLSEDKTMIALILYNKKILLQSFKKIGGLIKANDMNSNMVIYLLKLFSDGKIFCRATGQSGEHPKDKSKKRTATVGDPRAYSWNFGEERFNNFGVTSRTQLQFSAAAHNEGLTYSDPFASGEGGWTGFFNELVSVHSVTSPTCDPNTFLVASLESSMLCTSLVDLLIDLFQIVFPNLPLKVQMSLLEQMRSLLVLNTSQIDPLRLKAITINVSVALHGLSLQNPGFDSQTTSTLLEILSKIPLSTNPCLVELNSQSVGNLTSHDPELIHNHISKFTSEIVATMDPLKRGESVLKLAHIFHSSGRGFAEVYDIIGQLLNDPNPIVYYHAVRACFLVLEKGTFSADAHNGLLAKLHANYLDDSFGFDALSNRAFTNLKCQYGAVGQVSSILRLIITLLGPSLRELDSLHRDYVRTMIVTMCLGVGEGTTRDTFEVTRLLLLLFQELIIFDPTLIEGEVQYVTQYLKFVVSSNLKLGIAILLPTTRPSETLFPFTSSFELYRLAYSCLCELMKILGPHKLLDDYLINLLWISMNFKPCPELKDMIRFWMQLTAQQDSADGMNWFVTLSGVFRFSAKKLVARFVELNYKQKLLPLLQRQKKKHVNDDAKTLQFDDDESQNIVGDDVKASAIEKNEPITWEFKLFIFELLYELLSASSHTQSGQWQNRIQDIVNISFLGSTSPINSIRKQGVQLLDKTLEIFGDIPDPLYPAVSILEQQQAQIISALMPCYLSESDADLLVETINTSSRFINLPRIKFYSKQRILKTLIDLLEELSSNKFLRFDYLEDLSEFNKKLIQLAILNCWALLRIDSRNESEADDEGDNAQLATTLHKYAKLLNLLWILVLREYSVLKYSQQLSPEHSRTELAIYGDYWINFISVLSLDMEDPALHLHQSLGDDAANFLFILFSQCVELLVKGRTSEGYRVVGVLSTISRLVKSSEDLVVNYIFSDEIFGEVIDLFDRLILVDDDPEVQCQLIEILNALFHVYMRHQKQQGGDDALVPGFDKLFELIRVHMLPLFTILPFLRQDYDPSSVEVSYVLRHADSAPNLIVLKRCFGSIVQIISEFSDVVKSDLYSCLLFIFAKVYEYGNQLLISTVLPHLKQVLSELRLQQELSGVDIVTPFAQLVRGYYEIDQQNVNSVLTSMVLITIGGVNIGKADSEKLGLALVKMIEPGSPNATMAIHCVKTLIQHSTSSAVVKSLVRHLIELLVRGEDGVDAKVAMEVLFVFNINYKEQARRTQVFSMLVPLLLQARGLTETYVHQRLLTLVDQDSAAFRVVVQEVLTPVQRTRIQDMFKRPQAEQHHDEPQIALKRFGERGDQNGDQGDAPEVDPEE